MASGSDTATIRIVAEITSRATRASVEALQKLAAEEGITLEQLLTRECERAMSAAARRALKRFGG